MTYFAFLALFLGIPLIVIGALSWYDRCTPRPLPDSLRTFPARWGILVHILVAVLYTTPWDNYLVATRVWWYPPERVTGFTLGWVPIEEYTFFVLQSLLAGLWWLWLARRLPVDTSSKPMGRWVRWWGAALLSVVWFVALGLLWSEAQFTYMSLILLWSIPPIILQVVVGADILWRYRLLIGGSLLSLSAYLAVADYLAIGDGIWTIDPAQSLQIYLGGVLPLEELVFFLLTNLLLIFGLTLALSAYTQQRAQSWRVGLLRRTYRLRRIRACEPPAS